MVVTLISLVKKISFLETLTEQEKDLFAFYYGSLDNDGNVSEKTFRECEAMGIQWSELAQFLVSLRQREAEFFAKNSSPRSDIYEAVLPLVPAFESFQDFTNALVDNKLVSQGTAIALEIAGDVLFSGVTIKADYDAPEKRNSSL